MSFGQQRLWFLAQLESGSAAYNAPMAWRIAGPLNISELQRSLNQLVARHEALRTTFAAVDGYPRQIINEALPVSIRINDLRTVERSQRESEISRCIREEAKRPFILSAGPMLRAALFRIEEEEHIFVLTLHHIVCDGPSIAILLEELALFYEAFTKGKAIHLPEPQCSMLTLLFGNASSCRRSAMRNSLTGRNSCAIVLRRWISRQTARIRYVTSFRGDIEYRNLSRQLSEDFRLIARDHGVTDFMALVALFQVLLSRYTGQEDVCVGCPVTHRTQRKFRE